MSSLYNMACTARITGVFNATLRDFVVAYAPPVTASVTPAMPSQRELNEYTIWLTALGIEQQPMFIAAHEQPLTLSAAICVYTELIRDTIVCTPKARLDALNKLQNFIALMLRYPILPKLAVDTIRCPECYYEADVSFDTWTDTFEKMSCFHFTLRHEFFPSSTTNNTMNYSREDVDYNEMARFGTSESVIPRVNEQPNIIQETVGFLTQLEDLKRMDEISKQKTLSKDVAHRLQMFTHTLTELEAPRYLSPYPIICLLRLYGSRNRSQMRVDVLKERYGSVDVDVLRRVGRDLRAQLSAVAGTCTNDNVLSLVCMAMIGPLRRYDSRYDIVAERVVLFKHLISCGFSVDVASKVLTSIQTCKCAELLNCDLASGVDRQLNKTTAPTIYNIKIARLLWLASHISAYCTLRHISRDHVRMGDDPCDLTSDGIYIFDDDHVGFKSSPRGNDGCSHTAYVQFSHVVDMFAMRDRVETTLS